ncbi:MAG: RNase adapter RapZ [Pseudolysinimonas sp.]|uniref:RNase adapter RapZ n=1 Tax=Pseudolysinimonas sp. TaxID=2680009 RepID=UPI00326681EE
MATTPDTPVAKALRRELLLVTGMSGAGRSTVGNALEDLGWYVVDNLPPQMLRPLVDLSRHTGDSIPRVAAVVDIRGGRLFADVQAALESLRDTDDTRLLFLDATDAVLVRRFENVRRPHPLQGDGTLLDGISAERARMAELRSQADIVIDTSELNIHQLATLVQEQFAEEDEPTTRVTVLSFGYKYGLPSDADHVADCRFLPNPFWVPELKELTGLDDVVADYVLGLPGAGEFIDGYVAALRPVFDGYGRENKRHATIALGCTGGKHRSVAIAEELGRRLSALPGIAVSVKHRDLGRE